MQLMQQQNAAIRAVLTPDQQTVFDKNVADMQARMRRPPQ
jgi:Spy/CpxP family protein refolding chaperone